MSRIAVAGSRKSADLAAAEAAYSLPARIAHWLTAVFIILARKAGRLGTENFAASNATCP